MYFYLFNCLSRAGLKRFNLNLAVFFTNFFGILQKQLTRKQVFMFHGKNLVQNTKLLRKSQNEIATSFIFSVMVIVRGVPCFGRCFYRCFATLTFEIGQMKIYRPKANKPTSYVLAIYLFTYLFAEQDKSVIQFKTIHALQARGSLIKESCCHLPISKVRLKVVVVNLAMFVLYLTVSKIFTVEICMTLTLTFRMSQDQM